MKKQYNLLVYINSMSGVTYHRLLLPYKKLALQYDNINVAFVGNKITKDDLMNILPMYDAFIFSRNIEPALLKEIKGKLTIIDDIDDWWELDRTHGLYYQFKYKGVADNMKECCELSDYVTTTTPHLADKLKPYNNNVFIVDNALEPFGQFIPKHNPSNKIRFGIIGSSSHNNDMHLLDDITKYLPNHILDKIQFVLCGFDAGTTTIFNADGSYTQKPTDWPDVCWTKWESNLTKNYTLLSPAYAEYLQQYTNEKEFDATNEMYRRIWTLPADKYAIMYDEIDVLIAPLLDTPFNACKSELKMIEASVKNKALIISNVEPYKHLIQNNMNCIAVKPKRGAQGFAEAIVQYVQHPEKIEQYAANLAKLTKPESYFNLTAMTEKRYEWLTNILK